MEFTRLLKFCYNVVMDMNIIIGIIGAVGGLAGLVTAITTAIFKYLDYKKAQKGETLDAKLEIHLAPIADQLEAMRKQNQSRDEEIREIRLDTTRTQLYIKMEHEPHNHDTILQIAERYFCRLQGDWIATTDFQAWADREGIAIPLAISQAIAKNEQH